MKKIILILLILAVIVTSGVFIILVTGRLNPKEAGISIESTPASDVYINGELKGKTPYTSTLTPQEIIVKLIPQGNPDLAPYETKVKLTNGVKTIVKREFKTTEDESSGEIISFEKDGGEISSLAIVTIPDAAQISIDGQVRGFSPYKTSSVSSGEHLIKIFMPGYLQKELVVRTYPGYKLTILAKLAASPQASPSPSPSPTPEEEAVTYVEIQETPTGYLRVRSQPNTGGSEIGQVAPKERFPLLEEDTATGWFKIEYKTNQEGWISSQYAKKVKE